MLSQLQRPYYLLDYTQSLMENNRKVIKSIDKYNHTRQTNTFKGENGNVCTAELYNNLKLE